jgi:hypothetical protein
MDRRRPQEEKTLRLRKKLPNRANRQLQEAMLPSRPTSLSAEEADEMKSPTHVTRSSFAAVRAIKVFVEEHFWSIVILFGLVFTAGFIGIDTRKKMWADELITLYVARQTSLRQIINASLDGCDLTPPLYSFLVHVILSWVPIDSLAVRLPSTLGFSGMAFGFVAFCRRRWPAAYAVVPALLASVACIRYATEGRCYGLVFGCTAGALVCWQAAAEGRRRRATVPLLALCLMTAVALHFYAVFVAVPLLVGEIVRWTRSRRLDYPILAALAAGLPILLLHYPMIQAAMPVQEHHWSPARWTTLTGMYIGYAEVMCLAPALFLIASWIIPKRLLPDGPNVSRGRLTTAELAAIATFPLMPAGIFLLSKFSTGVFVDRYVLWAVAGSALLIGAGLYKNARHKTLVGIGMAAFLLCTIAAKQVSELRVVPLLTEGELQLRELSALPDNSQLFLIANVHVFQELSYYLDPRLRDRLVYLVNREMELHYLGQDTTALTLPAFARHANLRVVDYDWLLQANRRFILVASPYDYLLGHLVSSGFRVWRMGPTLYQVEVPPGVQR